MRISGIEPSSVILSQTKHFKKIKSDALKEPKQAKAKRYNAINPQNCNLNQFELGHFDAPKTLRINRSRTNIFLFTCNYM